MSHRAQYYSVVNNCKLGTCSRSFTYSNCFNCSQCAGGRTARPLQQPAVHEQCTSCQAWNSNPAHVHATFRINDAWAVHVDDELPLALSNGTGASGSGCPTDAYAPRIDARPRIHRDAPNDVLQPAGNPNVRHAAGVFDLNFGWDDWFPLFCFLWFVKWILINYFKDIIIP